jgi:hypothetical protein
VSPRGDSFLHVPRTCTQAIGPGLRSALRACRAGLSHLHRPALPEGAEITLWNEGCTLPEPMRTCAFLLALLFATHAAANEVTAPSPERRCGPLYAEGRVGTHVHAGGSGGEVLVPRVPSGASGAVSSADAPLSGGSSGGGGIGSGEGLLVLAVAAAVALPIILYAIDGDADEETLFRHGCPTFGLAVWAGAMNGAADSALWVPMTAVRASFAQGMLGVDASWEGTLDRGGVYGAVDAHLLLRAPPKKHVELGLALGARRVVFGGAERNGLEVALPHRYAFTRVGTRPLGLEVTPGVFIGTRGLDYRLEAALLIPVGPVSLVGGGRVYSFDHHVRAGAHAGLSFGF